MQEDRRYPRALLVVPVRIQRADQAESYGDFHTANLSRGGIFVVCENPLSVGENLRFSLSLKGKQVEGVGRVSWTRGAAEAQSTGRSPGMGIKFVKIEVDGRRVVEQAVDEQIAHQDDLGDPSRRRPSAQPQQEASQASFFPQGQSALPRPEERTQVRHARQFLESALSGLGGAGKGAASGPTPVGNRGTPPYGRRLPASGPAKSTSLPNQRPLVPDAFPAVPPMTPTASERVLTTGEAIPKAPKPPSEWQQRPRGKTNLYGDIALAPTQVDLRGQGQGSSSALRLEAHHQDLEREIASMRKRPASSQLWLWLMAALVLAGTASALVFSGALGTKKLARSNRSNASDTSAGNDGASDAMTDAKGTAAGSNASGSDEQAAHTKGSAVGTGRGGATVDLRFTSEPAGATVEVAGKNCFTPCTLPLPIGQALQVRVHKDGYLEAVSSLTPSQDTPPQSVELTAKLYVLKVVSDPPGTRVRIGRHRLTTPGEVELNLPAEVRNIPVQIMGIDGVEGTEYVARSSFTEEPERWFFALTLDPAAARAAAAQPGARAGGDSDAGSNDTDGTDATELDELDELAGAASRAATDEALDQEGDSNNDTDQDGQQDNPPPTEADAPEQADSPPAADSPTEENPSAGDAAPAEPPDAAAQ